MNSLIFLAAGEGRRVGAGKNKMLLSVNGKPLVWYSLKHVLQSRALDEIILVTQEKERPEFETVVWGEDQKRIREKWTSCGFRGIGQGSCTRWGKTTGRRTVH